MVIFLALSNFHYSILNVILSWIRLLLDVKGGLVLSLDNHFDFHTTIALVLATILKDF